MKIFIVSLGIILAQISGIVFASDLFLYNNAKFQLKVLTEECACGTALNCYSEELEEGAIDYSDPAIAEEYAVTLVSYANSNSPAFKNGTLEIVSFTPEDYAVTVELRYTAESDYFRLPLISERVISHESRYEFVEYEETS